MKIKSRFVLVALACVGLSGCDLHIPGLPGSKPAAPVGQVVATVNGQEITLRQLNAELGDATFTDAKQRKAAEQTALERLVALEVFAQAAKAQDIDKDPDFALERQRAVDALLAQALQAKLAAAVPPSTRDEAERFISDNPDMFAERKIFVVNQISARPPADADRFEKELEPLNTLDDVESLLKRENIPYQSGAAEIDAINLDPDALKKILALPANEVFVLPTNDTVLINQIVSTRIQPLEGEAAINFALDRLHQGHVRDAVTNELNALISKATPTIQYNHAFAPATGPATPASAAASPPS